MGMKANEVSDWLRRQHVGKRDHHEALRDDVVVIRPGPNFHWFMGSLAVTSLHPERLNRASRARTAASKTGATDSI